MTTRADLAAAVEASLASGQRAAIALVVETDGSVYRRAGARSVVCEDGTIHGIISGGCAEQDLVDRAREAWQTATTQWMTYDFRTPEDRLWGMGAGCNGSLTVCLIPVDPVGHPSAAQTLAADMRRRADTRDPFLSVTVLTSSEPARFPIGALTDAHIDDIVAQLPGEAGHVPSRVVVVHQGVQLELFVEQVSPRPRLVVFGAGDDVQPVIRLANDVDWHTSVIDHRVIFNNAARFPTADRRAIIKRDGYGTYALSEDDYMVIMTHNYELDRVILQHALPLALPYLGILGPRKRMQQLLQELVGSGVAISAANLEKVHSPIGLDIGAETADDIALSIVGELMARRRAKSGESLRLRAGTLLPPEQNP